MADDILTDDEAAALAAQVRGHPPLLSSAQVDAIETAFASPGFGMRRRAALAGAMQSGQSLMEVERDREKAVALAGVMSIAHDQSRKLTELAETFSALEARLLVALAMREDMDDVMDEGAAMMGYEKPFAVS